MAAPLATEQQGPERRLAQSSLRIELRIVDFLEHGARVQLTRSLLNLKGGEY
jgi:hypothetical protein